MRLKDIEREIERHTEQQRDPKKYRVTERHSNAQTHIQRESEGDTKRVKEDREEGIDEDLKTEKLEMEA